MTGGRASVVVGENAEDAFEVASVHDQEPVETLGADGADEALGGRVRLRRSHRVLMIWMPSLAKTASKSRVNLLSRSRIKKRNDPGCPWSVQANWRACWVTQGPVGPHQRSARRDRPYRPRRMGRDGSGRRAALGSNRLLPRRRQALEARLRGPDAGTVALPSTLFAAAGRARLRVRVSDGFNSVAAVSDGFSAAAQGKVTRTTLVVPRH